MGLFKRKPTRITATEMVESGLYPISQGIIRICDRQNCWEQLPTGGRLQAQCLGLFVAIQSAISSGAFTETALAQCVDLLYDKTVGEATDEAYDAMVALYSHGVNNYLQAFKRGGEDRWIEELGIEFARRCECEDFITMATMGTAAGSVLIESTKFLRKYEVVPG